MTSVRMMGSLSIMIPAKNLSDWKILNNIYLRTNVILQMNMEVMNSMIYTMILMTIGLKEPAMKILNLMRMIMNCLLKMITTMTINRDLDESSHETIENDEESAHDSSSSSITSSGSDYHPPRQFSQPSSSGLRGTNNNLHWSSSENDETFDKTMDNVEKMKSLTTRRREHRGRGRQEGLRFRKVVQQQQKEKDRRKKVGNSPGLPTRGRGSRGGKIGIRLYPHSNGSTASGISKTSSSEKPAPQAPNESEKVDGNGRGRGRGRGRSRGRGVRLDHGMGHGTVAGPGSEGESGRESDFERAGGSGRDGKSGTGTQSGRESGIEREGGSGRAGGTGTGAGGSGRAGGTGTGAGGSGRAGADYGRESGTQRASKTPLAQVLTRQAAKRRSRERRRKS
uniref:Fibroin heavy chain-like n=1 Tax=Caenorhabditis tropicalis TaxID=1561998 RepID=A0A1I7TRB3_9PELO